MPLGKGVEGGLVRPPLLRVCPPPRDGLGPIARVDLERHRQATALFRRLMVEAVLAAIIGTATGIAAPLPARKPMPGVAGDGEAGVGDASARLFVEAAHCFPKC